MPLPSMRPLVALFGALVASVILGSGKPSAYSFNDRWPQPQTTYFVNPISSDLGPAATEAAVRAGAAVWQQQTGAFRFVYSGTTTQTAIGADQINLVVFRNDAGQSSAIATTYWWTDQSSTITDADIVFWDGSFTFFAGSTGCSNGFYIEDIAAHEFGHALGLGHSQSSAATMYPSASSCDTALRSLDQDDIAGVRALYPQPPPIPTGVRIIGVGH